MLAAVQDCMHGVQGWRLPRWCKARHHCSCFGSALDGLPAFLAHIVSVFTAGAAGSWGL